MKKNPTKNNTDVSKARALQMTYAKRSVAIVYKI